MNKLLVINASARKERSYSRKLADTFTTYYQSVNEAVEITNRDLYDGPIAHLDEAWIVGAFKPKDQRTSADHEALALSNTLVNELKSHDAIVIATPMYNWSVPSVLKAYIDQVIRVNETLSIDPENAKAPYKGLLHNKKAYLILVRGVAGYESGELHEQWNYQTAYLKTVLGMMGITDVETIIMNNAATPNAEAEFGVTVKEIETLLGTKKNVAQV